MVWDAGGPALVAAGGGVAGARGTHGAGRGGVGWAHEAGGRAVAPQGAPPPPPPANHS